MKVIVDADACPVKDIIIKLCKKYEIDTIFIHSISHIPRDEDSYVKRIVVDNSPQAADMAIVNYMGKDDLVVTADTGLAAIVLGRGGYALNPWGDFYTNENIEELLEKRHFHQKVLAAGGRIKGPSKRKKSDNNRFSTVLDNFLQKINQITTK
ncbi:YaiI/YqxD family protein [Alkaliphilus serpentinus]|uniref:UPF0178 protein F8153_01435 n=1 Tax=Alkaliphilus serpentinus TaxID=1482731 RepID=A0A833HRH3_9FIRM|nr:YaiI/YqxD family protein [Alkaliphilus serpentinus]KAB3533237.1 YaiI/YqxD family protein [Alkaliphilus serpentinus]